MPVKLNQPVLTPEACQQYFPIWLGRLIAIQTEIRTVEYAAKIAVPGFTEPPKSFNYAKHMQIKLAKIDKDPSKEGKRDLTKLKQDYVQIAKECCSYLEFCGTAEMLAFSQHCETYVQKLIATNSKESWDELYNFSILVKNLAKSYPAISFLQTFSDQTIEPALDVYYAVAEVKESRKSTHAEMQPTLFKRKVLLDVHNELKRGFIFTNRSISPSSFSDNDSSTEARTGSGLSMSCYSPDCETPINMKRSNSI